MQKNKIINVQNLPITISKEEIDDYICITDIAAAKSDDSRAADVVRNWLRNRRTLEFLATWEEIYNPNFKVFESEHFKKFLSKNNYLIQTDAIKNYIIPNCNYRDDLQWLPYAEEADLLNDAPFLVGHSTISTISCKRDIIVNNICYLSK